MRKDNNRRRSKEKQIGEREHQARSPNKTRLCFKSKYKKTTFWVLTDCPKILFEPKLKIA